MDVLPMCSIFQELQIVHDTGYFSALPSLEEYWQQVNIPYLNALCKWFRGSGRKLLAAGFPLATVVIPFRRGALTWRREKF